MGHLTEGLRSRTNTAQLSYQVEPKQKIMKQSPRQTQTNVIKLKCSVIALFMKCMLCAWSKYEITVDLIMWRKKVGGCAAVPGLQKSDMGLRAVSQTGLAFFQLPINSKGSFRHPEREYYKINEKKRSQNGQKMRKWRRYGRCFSVSSLV